MAALPTRVRQNIRDLVDSPSSKLASRIETLKTTLGYPVDLQPEWSMIWEELKAFYPDPAIFIPNTSGVVVAWCDALAAWLDSEENEGVVEKLLDSLSRETRLKLFLEVSPTSRAKTAWDSKRCAFVIELPKAALIPSRSSDQASFASDLLALFDPSPVRTLDSELNEDPDAWAELSLESPITRAVPSLTRKAVLEIVSFPELASIPRPEELTKQPPYWLIVRQDSSTEVVVQSSHGPSLLLLEEYLKKWCRGDTNRSERPPVVEIKLRESAFGLGMMHDSLSLEAGRGREVNAMLILAFVESVLGYEASGKTTGDGVWEFKRLQEFE